MKLEPTADRTPGVGADSRTRDEVARLLLEQGPATAASLGARLKLSPAAVRRHLDTLLAEGLIEIRHQHPLGPRGRGRPAKLFALTGAGRESFPHAYDDLAAAALRYLAQTHGEAAVVAFAESRIAFLEERYGAAIAAVDSAPARLAILADALTKEGYAASADPVRGQPGAGQPSAGLSSADQHGANQHGANQHGANQHGADQLCQHHCPVAHVAAEFPQLCEAETRAFERLLGTHVMRLATIARGDGVCTTHLPVACRAPVGRTDRTERTHTPLTGRTP